MTLSVNLSTSDPMISTDIGMRPIFSLNNWNNTAFSQLCLSKSDDELLMLMHNPDLSSDKQEIAATKLAERHGSHV